MKKIIIYIFMFFYLSTQAQTEVKISQEKITKLYAEVLKNLANRKDNLDKYGSPVISVPHFSNDALNYIDSFISDGTLKELPDSTDWAFMKQINYSKITGHQNFEYKKVKYILSLKNVTLLKNKGLRNGFSSLIFNNEGSRACIAYFDYFSSYPGSVVITNKILAFYEWKDEAWKKVASFPLMLD